jgi:hypothetical protein
MLQNASDKHGLSLHKIRYKMECWYNTQNIDIIFKMKPHTFLWYEYHIYSNIRQNFFLIQHLKNGGLSYNRAQSSKNRANVFVVSNTVNICLSWVVQMFRCVTFLVLSRTTRPHVRQHPWTGKCLVLWNVSRLGSTLQLFRSVKMAYKICHAYTMHLVAWVWCAPCS